MTRDLVVRSEPGLHDGSEIYATRLNEPMFLYVVDGPAQADGFDWYLVQPFEVEGCMDACPWPVTFGWVAQAGQNGEQWVTPARFSCPSPTLAEIQWLPLPGRLACFGDEQLLLDGELGECFNEKMGGTLFASGCMLLTPGWEPGAGIRPPGITLRFTGSVTTIRSSDGSPSGLSPVVGTPLRVIGQFDHARATDCGREGYPVGQLLPGGHLELVESEFVEQMVLRCRSEFVASEIVVRD